jgi:hypothetical protein
VYLAELKATVVKGLRDTFDNDFPIADFRNVRIGLDFPINKQEYPSVWVDYDPSGPLRIAGIGHSEYAEEGTGYTSLYRWTFSGSVSFTVVALTSLERDRLLDALIQVLAFSRLPGRTGLRDLIEHPDSLIGMNFDWDEVEQRGFSTAPGTPWGTDEMMYEGTLAMEVVGEFVVSDASVLVPVSRIEVIDFVATDPDPTTPGGWLEEYDPDPQSAFQAVVGPGGDPLMSPLAGDEVTY